MSAACCAACGHVAADAWLEQRGRTVKLLDGRGWPITTVAFMYGYAKRDAYRPASKRDAYRAPRHGAWSGLDADNAPW